MKAVHKMILVEGILIGIIWRMWWAGVVDGRVIIEGVGNCTGNGSHIFTVEGCNLTGNCLNWTITN